MPHLKQSAKRLRQSIKKAAVNKKIKDGVDYLFHQFKKSLAEADSSKSAELAKKLAKAIDKAAEKHVYHANNAARKKSRMMKKLNSTATKK
ncbi:30S ribosomal protein S20 [Candidatus Kuenenbacteria bacterium]|nr:30S ribosomal protein S20 [Candidatus Kuenenbacteria bacterium]